jgi:hypothetical protein
VIVVQGFVGGLERHAADESINGIAFALRLTWREWPAEVFRDGFSHERCEWYATARRTQCQIAIRILG